MTLLKTFVLLTFLANAQTPVTVSTEVINDVAHVEFSGRDNWQYDLQRMDNGLVTMEVDKIDDKSIVTLKTFSNPFVTAVEIGEGSNNKQKITFKLKDKNTRSFEYVTDQPSRLVIDFYIDQEIKAENKKQEKKITALPKKKTRTPADLTFSGQEIKQIKPKVDVANLDGADPLYDRFRIKEYEIKESAIIGSKLNLYIHFPMMTVPINELEELHSAPVAYHFEKEENDENKKARLLLTLFNKNRNAVFFKALELFREEFPDSKYKEELSFMEADTFYKMWLKDKDVVNFEKAMSLYSKVVLSVKNSKYHDYVQRLMAYAYFEKGDYLSAFTNFQRYLNQNAESPYKYKMQIAKAECLVRMNNTNDAFEIYNQMEADEKAGPYAIEAAFRKANIFAAVEDYKNAIAEYERVSKKYASSLKDYPSAFYNKAESKFWLNMESKTLHDSLNDYITFIDQFPKNAHSSYAMERVGELLEMLGAPQGRYEGAFLETIYRYPNSQASGVAKIRLLRQRIDTMKEKDIDDEVAKIDDFIKSSNLEKLKEFKTIMISDGYYAKKSYDKALGILLAFYQENPLSNYLDVFKKRIVKTFRDQMLFSVDENDFIKTFQVYGKNAATWFKGEDRLDIPYILGMAFEKSGVPDEAVNKYQLVLNKLYSIKGTQEEKERAVFENIPSTDELNLRLASVFVFKSEYGKALDHLKEISPLKLPTEDLRVENVYLASVVHEKLNNMNYAIDSLKKLTDSWRGNPEKISKVLFRLANLQNQIGKNLESISSIDRLLNISKDSELVETDIQIQAYELKAKIQLAEKNNTGAAETYKELLEKFEANNPLYSSRYQLGKIYYDKKEIKDAEKVWGPLQDKADAQIWHKLAQENLKNFNFKDEYKKYVDRIPAMDNEKKGEKK